MVVQITTAIGLFSKVYCLLFNVLLFFSFRRGTFHIVPSLFCFVNSFFNFFQINFQSLFHAFFKRLFLTP